MRIISAVLAQDGFLKILPGQIRGADVSFIRWERFPGGESPKRPSISVAPDLAVEILSEGNTVAEMDRKLREYFKAGVRLVWYIEPKTVRRGPTRPCMNGRRSVRTIRSGEATFCPASNCRLPSCSPASIGQGKGKARPVIPANRVSPWITMIGRNVSATLDYGVVNSPSRPMTSALQYSKRNTLVSTRR